MNKNSNNNKTTSVKLPTGHSKLVKASLNNLKFAIDSNELKANIGKLSGVIGNFKFNDSILSNPVRISLSRLENIKLLSDSELIVLKKSFNDFKPLVSNYSSYIKRLKKLTVVELINLYSKLKEEDGDFKQFLKSFINKKLAIEWLSNFIKKINKVIKKVLNGLLKLARNRRFYFRKTQSFRFKNLDDYHSTTIIQNLQFKVIQPSVLILNNRVNETKYFKQN